MTEYYSSKTNMTWYFATIISSKFQNVSPKKYQILTNHWNREVVEEVKEEEKTQR